MPRYIDADELLKVLDIFSDKEGEKADFFAQKNLDELSTKYNHGQYCYENVKNIVNTMSTVNVLEVKHAEWVECSNELNKYCSNCKAVNGTIYAKPPFCEKCGAKMIIKGGAE